MVSLEAVAQCAAKFHQQSTVKVTVSSLVKLTATNKTSCQSVACQHLWVSP